MTEKSQSADPTSMPEVTRRFVRAVKAFELRHNVDLSQEEVGALVGFGKDGISALIGKKRQAGTPKKQPSGKNKNKRKTFTVAEAWRASQGLGCDPCWLAFGRGTPPGTDPAEGPLRDYIPRPKERKRRA